MDYALAAQAGTNGGAMSPVIAHSGEDTLTWFYLYLSSLLARTPVVPVDIGKYVDPNLPPMIHKIL